MDPIATLWFASLAGAAGFTATGVYLGRMLDAARQKTAAETTRTGDAPAEAAPPSAPPASQPTKKVEPAPEPAGGAELESASRLTALEIELDAAGDRLEAAADIARQAEAARADLERQLEAVRVELRNEIVARTRAETKSTQLTAQLARVARSIPPPAAAPIPRTEPTSVAPGGQDRRASLAPGLFAEITELKKEVSRLRGENQTLLAASGNNRRKPPRAAGELLIPDTEALRRLVERVGRIDGVRGVVVADTMGSVLAGAGELLEPIGAFGAYISDSASRVELLLPLESPDEIVVRDRKLGVVSTLRLGDPRVELALVMFAVDEGPTREMQQVFARSGLI